MKVQIFWDDTCLTLRKEIGGKIPVDPMMLYLGVIKEDVEVKKIGSLLVTKQIAQRMCI